MEIKNVEHKPYEKSVLPSIIFGVEISHVKYQEAIIGVSGWLETDDGKVIASINEDIYEKRGGEIGARGSKYDSEFKDEIYRTRMVAILSEKALDYIEKRRMADKKGDVKLNLCLNVKYLQSRAEISESFLIDPKKIGLPEISIPTSRRDKSGKIVAYAYDPDFSSSYTNRWIISGSGSPVFLEVREQLLKKDVRIPSTDWIHDYAPKLEIGEYFVVEIPKGEKVIEEAWDYVEKAEECFRTWDTKGVFANCREVGKLLDKIVSNKFKNSPAIKKWKRAIEKFNYSASLDLHLEDIKEEKPKGDVEIRKAEAEHILIITKALIKYAEELLKEG